MPRYIVERAFPEPVEIPTNDDGRKALSGVVERNGEVGVTWVQSFVTADHRRTFCVYDGPSPEAIREAAGRNGFPVTGISEVSVLDPYFYVGSPG